MCGNLLVVIHKGGQDASLGLNCITSVYRDEVHQKNSLRIRESRLIRITENKKKKISSINSLPETLIKGYDRVIMTYT